MPCGDDSTQFLKRQTQPLIGSDMQHAGGAASGKILNDHRIHGAISCCALEFRCASPAFIAKCAWRLAVLSAEGTREAGRVRIAEPHPNIGHGRILADQRIGGLQQSQPAYRVRERLARHGPEDAMPVMG
jgi:hypothetical protein